MWMNWDMSWEIICVQQANVKLHTHVRKRTVPATKQKIQFDYRHSDHGGYKASTKSAAPKVPVSIDFEYPTRCDMIIETSHAG